MGDFRGALNNEKETYLIYKKELGANHEKTKESSECLRHLTNQAVVLQKKMNEIYKGNLNTFIPPIQIQPPSISSVMELLNVINGILFLHITTQDAESLREIQTVKSKQSQQEKDDTLDTKSSDKLLKNGNIGNESQASVGAKDEDHTIPTTDRLNNNIVFASA